MRISDWSSDVCSSDLAIGAGTRRRLAIAGKPPAIELDQRPRDQHAEADDEEARPPAEQIGEDRANELPPDRSAIDPHIEDREPRIAAAIAFFVKLADHRRDVGFEEAVADRDRKSTRLNSSH